MSIRDTTKPGRRTPRRPSGPRGATPAAPPAEVTDLLHRWTSGDGEALEEVLPRVYRELRRVAQRAFRQTRWDATLQATGLVHEAYLRLREAPPRAIRDRGHFFGVAARLMRQILVDEFRRQSSLKRGGAVAKVYLEEAGEIGAHRPPDLLRLDDALTALERLDARKAQVVELRFFGGLSTEEISSHLGVAPATVGREWRKARAWLYRELAQP